MIKRLLGILLLSIALFIPNAEAAPCPASKDFCVYPADTRTGGGAGALDAIDGDDLNKEGSFAIVGTGANAYFYTLLLSGCGVEDDDNYIMPDTNPGTKCWKKISPDPDILINNTSSITTTGDLTVNTDKFKVDATTGYVGIGTSTPSSALDIVGDATITGGIGLPPEYIVYLDGSDSVTHKVKDGNDGSIDYTNTVPDVAVQWAIDNAADTVVSSEVYTDNTADNSQTIFRYTLPAIDAGTLTIAWTESAAKSITDTGNSHSKSGDCNQTGDTADITSCTVNYVTGQLDIVFAAAPDTGNITLTYDHGRTKRAVIWVVGNFALTETLTVPSYIELVIFGKWTDGGISGGSVRGLITNNDTTNGNTDITILGGYIDLERNEIAVQAVKIVYGNNIIVWGMDIRNSYAGSIELQYTKNFKVKDNTIKRHGDDGVSIIYDSSHGIVSYNDISEAQGLGATASYCIECEDGCSDVLITGNICHDNTEVGSGNDGGGIHVNIDGGSGFVAPYNVTVSNNVVENVLIAGIAIVSSDSTKPMKEIVVVGNIITNAVNAPGITFVRVRNSTISNNTVSLSGIDGITFTRTFDTTISNNIMINNGVDDVPDYNLYFSCASGGENTRNVISNNTMIDTRATKLVRGIGSWKCDDQHFYNNNVSHVADASPFVVTGGGSGIDKAITACPDASFTITSHGLILGQGVTMATASDCNLTSGTLYYVTQVEDTNTVQFATTRGGTAIDGGADATITMTATTATDPTLNTYSGNIGYVTENEGSTSVADGGTISHGLAGTPDFYRCDAITASETCSVTAVSSSTLTVAIKKDDGTGGTTQAIQWQASFKP